MPLDHLLDDRQADARALVPLARVQSLEEDEDPVEVLGLDPDPVVRDRETPPPVLALGRDPDPRELVRPELERVLDQVVEDQLQFGGITADLGERVVLDHGAELADLVTVVAQHVAEHLFEVDRLERPLPRADAGEEEEVLDQPLHAEPALDDVAEDLLCVPLEPVPVPPLEELHVRDDRPYRFLQVVAGRVGIALERLVRDLEFVDHGPETALGLDPRRDVLALDDGRGDAPVGGAQGARGPDDDPGGPVAVDDRPLDALGSDAGLADGRGDGGQGLLEGAPLDPRGRPARERREGPVQARDPAADVEDEDGARGLLEQALDVLPGLAELVRAARELAEEGRVRATYPELDDGPGEEVEREEPSLGTFH